MFKNLSLSLFLSEKVKISLIFHFQTSKFSEIFSHSLRYHMYDDMCGSVFLSLLFLPNNFIHAGHERRAKNNAIIKLTCNSIDFGFWTQNLL